jgi:hypothetical protein
VGTSLSFIKASGCAARSCRWCFVGRLIFWLFFVVVMRRDFWIAAAAVLERVVYGLSESSSGGSTSTFLVTTEPYAGELLREGGRKKERKLELIFSC